MDEVRVSVRVSNGVRVSTFYFTSSLQKSATPPPAFDP